MRFNWPPAQKQIEKQTIETGAKTSVGSLIEQFEPEEELESGPRSGDPFVGQYDGTTGAQESVESLRQNFEPVNSNQPVIPEAPPPPQMKQVESTIPLAPPQNGNLPPPLPPTGPLTTTAPKTTGMAPRQKAVAAPKFGKEFESTSLGVESELSGFSCALPQNADRTFAYVKHAGTGEPLVMITKDMSTGPYNNPSERDFVQPKDHWKIHTVELVTYPAAMNDQEATGHRNLATRMLLKHFFTHLGTHNHEPLSNVTVGDYELVVTNKNHVLAAGNGAIQDAAPAVSMPTSGQQATMGVKASEFGTGATAELQMLEGAPWYHKGYGAEIAKELEGNDNAAEIQGVYAFMKSIIEFTSQLVQKYALPIGSYDPGVAPKAQGLTDPAVKNEWKILPRTKPTIMFEMLEGASRSRARALVAQAQPVGDGTIWAAVKEYILNGGEVAGHGINDAKIDGEQAMLFEFRSIPDGLSGSVPTEEAKPVAEVIDPMGSLPQGVTRGKVLPPLKAFALDHFEDFKSWLADPKWDTKSPQVTVNGVAANQLANWLIAKHPGEWLRITTPAPSNTNTLLPPPVSTLPPPVPMNDNNSSPLTDGTFNYAM